MANYSDDNDLIELAPKIKELGVDDWSKMHDEAKKLIDREVEVKWYKERAREHGVDWTSTPYNPDLVLGDDFKRLSSFKALELIFRFLLASGPESEVFQAQMQLWHDLYEEELEKTLSYGIGYDWDASGAVEPDERLEPAIRRLVRG